MTSLTRLQRTTTLSRDIERQAIVLAIFVLAEKDTEITLQAAKQLLSIIRERDSINNNERNK